jgi:uncharacterized protein YoxC
MSGELGTTNLLLGIMAAVSLLEAFAILGMGIAGFKMYSRVITLVDGVESRHVIPAMARVNAILDDVQPRVNSILDDVRSVTTTVKDETERVDQAFHHTMHRIDDTADRMRTNVRAKTSTLVGIVRGLRVVIEGLLVKNGNGVPRM